MKLLKKITTVQEIEVDIQFPIFRKYKDEYWSIIDEETAIKVNKGTFMNKHVGINFFSYPGFVDAAIYEGEEITKDEFFNALDIAGTIITNEASKRKTIAA